MCDVCGHSWTHADWCPYNPGAPKIGTCARCGKDVYKDHGYVDDEGNMYCECIDNMTVAEFLKLKEA